VYEYSLWFKLIFLIAYKSYVMFVAQYVHTLVDISFPTPTVPAINVATGSYLGSRFSQRRYSHSTHC